ncbi:MAG TPA: MarR family winged helix-turn-helix transcriptional regulator [Syntrophomonadaceae bacterium]|nr:MarR family winged helix-turn-helix transcriptional regulator [Syntrophomonadaceae bacterium]
MDYSDWKVKLAAEVVQSFVGMNRIILKFTQQNADSLGLTVAQMGVLNTIYAFPGITLKEISLKTHSPKSTISISIDGLATSGVVERKPSAEDRREVFLYVTSRGEKLARKSCENALSYKAMMLALEKIPQEDIQTLLEIHQDLLINLQKVEL